MTSPNSRIATTNRVNSRSEGGSLVHQPLTVYVGKEQYPINLSPLLDVSTSTWKKQRGYDQLEAAVISLRNTHQVADLMELVRQEVPIDMDSAAQESTKQMQKVLASVYKVENLNGSAFLTSQSKLIHLKSENLGDR